MKNFKIYSFETKMDGFFNSYQINNIKWSESINESIETSFFSNISVLLMIFIQFYVNLLD